jgi:creatinine amidohydrolase
MSTEPDRLALDELSWIDVAAHLAHDPRLIIPVGALEQHGPHLPLGANVLIARRFSLDLSHEFGVLRAPTFSFGVNVHTERAYAGTAALSRKTLHRALNELLDCWEGHGVTEFIMITGHRHDPHLEALATLLTTTSRVRVLDIWDVEIHDLLDGAPTAEHAGEAETSLMLHLYPDLVRMDRARDFTLSPDEFRRYMRGGMPAPPAGGTGCVGRPTLATADKGKVIYDRILDVIRRAVFLRPDQDSDTL